MRHRLPHRRPRRPASRLARAEPGHRPHAPAARPLRRPRHPHRRRSEISRARPERAPAAPSSTASPTSCTCTPARSTCRTRPAGGSKSRLTYPPYARDLQDHRLPLQARQPGDPAMKRALLILLAVLIALPAAAFVAARILLNGDAIRTRVAASVQRATGRELTIAGPVQLAWSLTPTIEASDAEPRQPARHVPPRAGPYRPGRGRGGAASLLERRVEIRHIRLLGPDIQLERDAQGRPNWLFTRPESPPSAQPAAPSTERRFEVAIERGRHTRTPASPGWPAARRSSSPRPTSTTTAGA